MATSVQAMRGRFSFGTEGDIKFLGKISLTGANGEELFLGRKVSTKSFLLPYTYSDEGYVLGVMNDWNAYYSFSEGERLAELQGEGLLPDPLPEWKPDGQIFFGYALWWGLGGIFLWIGVKMFFAKLSAKARVTPNQ